MAEYSIRDLEQLSGIKAHTLRIWEQRYKLIKPNRSDTNIRNYNNEQMKLLLNVAMLRTHGYKISEIAKYSSKQIENEVTSLTEKQLHFPDQVQQLTTSMLEFNEEKFEQILNVNIEKVGLEQVMIHIIYPFLTKIGILWTTNAIAPAQEHFMTNLIRQKIIVAIENLPKELTQNPKTIVLYLPEGEYHEIGLLFAQYIFKAKKQKVVYLGQSLPKADLTFVCNVHKPNFIFTAITSSPGADKIQSYLNWLSTEFQYTNVLITGYQVVNKNLQIHKNLTIVSSVEELLKISNWL